LTQGLTRIIEYVTRTSIQTNLVKALKTSTKIPIFFGKLSKKKLLELNRKLIQSGHRLLSSNDLYIHPRVIKKLQLKRIVQDKMSPDQVADIAFSAIHNAKSKVLSTQKPHIKIFVKTTTNFANSAYVAEFGGNGSIKSIHPKNLRKIQRNSLGGRGVPPSGAFQLNPAAPIPAIQRTTETILEKLQKSTK